MEGERSECERDRNKLFSAENVCLRERETVWGRLLLRGCERVNTYEDVARERERESRD